MHSGCSSTTTARFWNVFPEAIYRLFSTFQFHPSLTIIVPVVNASVLPAAHFVAAQSIDYIISTAFAVVKFIIQRLYKITVRKKDFPYTTNAVVIYLN